ncbi:MAG: serine hydrolase domain-containing protein [Acidobacteriota bacterium]
MPDTHTRRHAPIPSRSPRLAFVVLTALIACGLHAAETAPSTEASPSAAALDAALQTLHADNPFPGFAVAVVDRDDGVLYSKGFGWADRKAETPFTPKTVLNIGSVSKTFIGVALMQAEAKGQIDLDAPIDRHLPYTVRNPRFPDTAITLRHLATHTSGIEDRESIYRKAYSEGSEPSMALGDYLKRYLDPEGAWFDRRNFGDAAPGEQREYSNIGAALAAHVLERATGEPFDVSTTRTILEPLGMDGAGWSYADAASSRHATLYDGRKVVDLYTLVTYPDGGMRADVESLTRYLQAMLHGGELDGARILSESSVAAMVAAQHPADSPLVDAMDGKNSGIFWSINAKGRIGHTGGDPGIATALAFDPETGRGWIFVTNTELNRKNVEAFREVWSQLGASFPSGDEGG